MRFGEKIVVFIFRPIYRTFFERLFWWFLLKVKVFMLAEVRAQLDSVELRLRADDAQRRLAAIEERLRAAELSNAAQWDALEQLLLALFRQPESRASDPDWKVGAGQENSISNARDLMRAHAARNLR